MSGRVLFLITDTRRGGTPHKMATIVRGMAERGWEMGAASVLPRGPVLDDLAAGGLATFDMDLDDLKQLPHGVRKLRRAIDDFKPDILQTALWHADVLGRVASLGKKVTVLNGYENVDDDKGSLRVWSDRTTHRIADGHYAISEAVARRVHERDHVPLEAITVIQNAIDVDAWAPRGRRSEMRARIGVPEDVTVIGWVGRMHPVKDLKMLIDTVAVMDGPHLVLAGWGQDREHLDGWARAAGASDRVHVLGEVADVAPLLEAFDVFCLTSRWEGVPIALMEAMAASVPVVSTRTGGVPELIEHGVDGILVDRRSPEAYARAIEAALGDPDIGNRALKKMREHFSAEVMVDGFEDFWKGFV